MTLTLFTSDPLSFVYVLCTVFGGTVLLLQIFMSLVGFGGGEDLDGGDTDAVDAADGNGPDGIGHSDTVDLFKVLSFRTVIAGLTFAGLGGLAGITGNFGRPMSVLFAAVCGTAAIFGVYYLYKSIAKLRSDGSVTEKSLVGASGTVYLRIPAAQSGIGKVQVSQQNRTMEYEAVTLGDELKNGTPITVVRIVSPTVVEVR